MNRKYKSENGRKRYCALIGKRREEKTKRIVKKTKQGRGPTFVAQDRNTVRLTPMSIFWGVN